MGKTTNLTKLTLAGALALTLAACHAPGHEFCDWNDDGDTDGGCVLLVVGVKAAAGAVAYHAIHEGGGGGGGGG